MRNLSQRMSELSDRLAARRLQQLAARTAELLPDGTVSTGKNQIDIVGKGLVRRWLHDPALRFLTRDGS